MRSVSGAPPSWRRQRPRNHAYRFALVLNTTFNAVRRRLGLPYWSLSQWAKLKVKNAVNYIGEFEKTLVLEARRNDAEGVICGHIHHAVIHENFGIRYMNCGDWVESCTALAEHADGRFEVISWFDHAGTLPPLEGDEEPVLPFDQRTEIAA